MPSLRRAEKFEPADFSIEELEFLLAHLKESPNVALHEMDEEGVNPKQIRPILARFTELEELRTVRDVPWAGYDAIQASITRFLDWHNRSMEIQAEGGPRHPSQHNWDEDGTMTRGGTGADSSEKIRSEIADDGERIPFTVMLREVPGGGTPNMPWVPGSKRSTGKAKRTTSSAKNATRAGDADNGIVHDAKLGLFTCKICNEAICTYQKRSGQRGLALAKRKVERHLRTARKGQARHRAILRSGKW